jgi:hypothetical protein
MTSITLLSCVCGLLNINEVFFASGNYSFYMSPLQMEHIDAEVINYGQHFLATSLITLLVITLTEMATDD